VLPLFKGFCFLNLRFINNFKNQIRKLLKFKIDFPRDIVGSSIYSLSDVYTMIFQEKTKGNLNHKPVIQTFSTLLIERIQKSQKLKNTSEVLSSHLSNCMESLYLLLNLDHEWTKSTSITTTRLLQRLQSSLIQANPLCMLKLDLILSFALRFNVFK
jgi:hypothetical protein